MCNLQAVILAGGKGNRLESVDGNAFDIWEENERALLPLAGIPLFWYPLNVLAKNNIKEILLITNAACLEKIKCLLENGSLPKLPELNIEVVAPPEPEEDDFDELGSADVLNKFADRINRDFILLTGYFVSDIQLQKMIERHYEKSSVLTCLISDKASNSAAPGPKDQQSYRDFIGICEKEGQLVYLQSEEELDLDSRDTIHVKNALDLMKANCVELTSAYVDCHVYLMDYRLLNVLSTCISEVENVASDRESFSSLKVDFIPYLLEKQYREDQTLQNLFKLSNLQMLAQKSQNGSDKEPTSQFRIFVYKSTPDVATLIGKCNTIGAFLETNKAVLDMKKPLLKIENVKYSGAKINVIKSQIDKSSTIGESEISIVKSSVGKNCKISKSVKVEESIVMDGVEIDSGCQLKRCFVGRGAKIEKGCKLQNCVIDANHIVSSKTTANDAFLQSEQEWEY